MDPVTILTAFIPVISDTIKKISDRFILGRKISVDDEIKIIQAETERLKALAELDKPAGEVSRWVSDFRAVFRYMFSLAILIFTCGLIVFDANPQWISSFIDLTSGVVFFLIGHRTYLYFLNKK